MSNISENLLSRFTNYYQREGLKETVKRSGYELASYTDVPWMLFSWMLPGSSNIHEIRIIAQRRTGHHAIVNWMLEQIPGRYCFLNNCKANSNPFMTCQRETSVISSPLFEHSWSFWDQECSGKLSKKGVLLYNYEDKKVSEAASKSFEANRVHWVGQSDRQTDVLIMRDPFNLLASRLRWVRSLGFKFEAEELIETWKEHAWEFLGETSYLSNKVTINYNRWFCDQSYRQEISSKLGLQWTDKGMQEVARWGPTVSVGSFDGLAYDGKAHHMKVLDRWKNYASDPVYLECLKDKEIFELSERIFGEVAGTNSLLDKV